MTIKPFAFWLGAGVLMLGACGPAKTEVSETFEMLDVVDLKVPEKMAAGADLVAGFESGKSTTLTLDRCPTEPVWETDKGPIGSLTCGATYEVFYVPEAKAWVAMGPNKTLKLQKAAQDITAAAYVGKPPSAKEMTIWGLGVTWTPEGDAFLSGKTLIGRLNQLDQERSIAQPAASNIAPKVATKSAPIATVAPQAGKDGGN